MDLPQPYIVLDYTKRNEKFNYVVNLLFVPSNLGEGEILYFECPKTKKRCRCLYLIGDYFTHREAYKGTYYEKQTYSKRSRDLDRFYSAFHEEEKARLELNSKHFKKFYNGQPTKRYKRLFSIIRKFENYIKSDFYASYR